MDESPFVTDSTPPQTAPQQCEFGCDLKCLHCGYQARREGTRRNCSSNAPRPSLGTQLTGYAAAVSRWLAAGAPKRSDEEVDDLLAICQACPTGRYDASRGACSKCGCKVNASSWAILNKLRMATESCPDGHWGAVEPPKNPGKLRVGFLTPNLIVGGVESWLISLVRELQALGSIHVSGVGHTAGDGLWSPIIADELGGLCPTVSSASIPGAARVSSPAKAAQAVAAASDVLIVWSVTPAILAACQGPRIVGVSHGCNDWWMADCAKLVDEWVAVAEVARTPCPDPARVHVIPNGVDVARCNSSLSVAQARERLGLPAWARVAGYVGRFSSEKRVQQIAESINWLPQDWHLLFVGDGRDKIEPSDRVHVLPPTRDRKSTRLNSSH